MCWLKEYSLQITFVALQTVVVIYGCAWTAALLKIAGYPDGLQLWPTLVVFVRHWGFLFLLIPTGWGAGTVWMERNQYQWFSKRWTIVSGLVVCGFLIYFFMVVAIRVPERTPESASLNTLDLP